MAIASRDDDNDDKSKKDNTEPTLPKKSINKGKAIAALVIIAILIAITVWGVWMWTEGTKQTERALESGCQPQAFNQMGRPTWYLCPPGVELN
ncbi:MAG: hypothetical protein ACRD5J_16605 [Nitrososphaeraceae archaeon]